MTSYACFPPHRIHSSHPISAEQALTLLSTYLSATTVDASLHPNALLTESGPVSATSGANTGLVLHNLKRVEAGLRGEHLGADLSFAKFGGTGLPDLQVYGGHDGLGAVATAAAARAVDLEGQGVDADMGQEGWQDRGEFERQQQEEEEISEGGIGDALQGVGLGVGTTVEGGDVPTSKRPKSNGEKMERKKRKKERRTRELREKESRRGAAASIP